jgi:hypothetical protein
MKKSTNRNVEMQVCACGWEEGRVSVVRWPNLFSGMMSGILISISFSSCCFSTAGCSRSTPLEEISEHMPSDRCQLVHTTNHESAHLSVCSWHPRVM